MSSKTPGDRAYTLDSELFVPDVRIRNPVPSQTLRALRGYSSSVAVLSSEGRCIGWMHCEDLPGGPYPDVLSWMRSSGAAGSGRYRY